jgi:hypothetical protein
MLLKTCSEPRDHIVPNRGEDLVNKFFASDDRAGHALAEMLRQSPSELGTAAGPSDRMGRRRLAAVEVVREFAESREYVAAVKTLRERFADEKVMELMKGSAPGKSTACMMRGGRSQRHESLTALCVAVRVPLAVGVPLRGQKSAFARCGASG